MKALLDILRSKQFRLAAGTLFALQFILLLFTTPLYELDTNSYIRGMFSWSIYHNPFTNLYIGLLTKIWANVWFIVSFQLLLYALCASFFLKVLLNRGRAFWIGVGIAAIEPVTLFYNFSLISDSAFTSFLLLTAGLAILYLRRRGMVLALFFGLALGFAFLARLSANIFLPLFGLILILPGIPWKERIRDFALALLPFAACYAFVLIGQGIINEGALYTVKGRVLWDFSSSQYDPEEVDAPLFHRFIEPYIFVGGELVADRETRRELSYLGYKDCLGYYEGQGAGESEAILACDSIWGAAAQQIRDRHFAAAAWQFVRDNLDDLLHKNYLEYRFTPGLHYYHPEEEYAYLDSVMVAHYSYSLPEREERIPRIWRNQSFTNRYAPPIWLVLWFVGILSGIRWLKNRRRIPEIVLAVLLLTPLLFHLVYISYRLRFIAPYIVMGLVSLLYFAPLFLKGLRSGDE